MRRSTSRCDTILALIDQCLAEYDAAASSTTRANREFSRFSESAPRQLLGCA
jgi:hypothetical protein